MVTQHSRDLVAALRAKALEVKTNREGETVKKAERIAQLEREVKRQSRRAKAANKRADELEAIDRTQRATEWELTYERNKFDALYIQHRHLLSSVRMNLAEYEARKVLHNGNHSWAVARKANSVVYHSSMGFRRNANAEFYKLDLKTNEVTRIDWTEMMRLTNDYYAHLVHISPNDPMLEVLKKAAK